MTERKITISEREFTIPQPFAAGHVCTEGDAKALNQTYAEAIRNNFASKVKIAFGDAPTEELNPSTIEALVAEYAANYVFTIGNVSTKVTMSPVEKEALKIAATLLDAKLAEKGLSKKKIGAEKYEELRGQIAVKDNVVAAAKKAIKAREELAKSALGDDMGDLGLTEGEGETATA